MIFISLKNVTASIEITTTIAERGKNRWTGPHQRQEMVPRNIYKCADSDFCGPSSNAAHGLSEEEAKQLCSKSDLAKMVLAAAG